MSVPLGVFLADFSTEFYDQTQPSKRAKFECSAISDKTTRVLTIPDKDGTLATTDDITNVFNDNVFSVQNAADTSKKLRFDAGEISAAATRVLTVPDKDGTLATTDDILTTFSDAIFEISNAVDPTKIGKFDAHGIDPATERTYQLPNSDGTLALTTDISTTFSDETFGIFEGVSPTKILSFDVSDLPSATTTTLGIEYQAENTKLTTNSPPITGLITWATRPWLTNPSANYTIIKFGPVVFLRLSGVSATANAANRAVTTAFIPTEYRPTTNTFMSVPGASNSVASTIAIAVLTTGVVDISVTNGASFAPTNIAEYGAFTMWWLSV